MLIFYLSLPAKTAHFLKGSLRIFKLLVQLKQIVCSHRSAAGNALNDNESKAARTHTERESSNTFTQIASSASVIFGYMCRNVGVFEGLRHNSKHYCSAYEQEIPVAY